MKNYILNFKHFAPSLFIIISPIMSQSESEATTALETKPNPTAAFVSQLIAKQVKVTLHNDFVYEGILKSIDGFMNIVLESADEITLGKKVRTYNEVFIRGNNVMAITKL